MPLLMRKLVGHAVLAICLAVPAEATAASTVYGDPVAFSAALPEPARTLDFDSLTAGTPVLAVGLFGSTGDPALQSEILLTTPAGSVGGAATELELLGNGGLLNTNTRMNSSNALACIELIESALGRSCTSLP